MKIPKHKISICHILAGVAPGQWWDVWRVVASPGEKSGRRWRHWWGVVCGSESSAVAQVQMLGKDGDVFEIEPIIPLSER